MDNEKRHRRAIVIGMIDELLKEDDDVKAAYHAMKSRGQSSSAAKDEIARALLGCLWERNRGGQDRWVESLTALAEGRTASELFPNELYESGDTFEKH